MFGMTAGTLAAATAITAIPAMIAGAGIFFIAWAATAWVICAILVALAAHGRGRSAWAWLAFAILLTPLPTAVILVAFTDRSEQRQRIDATRSRDGLRLCPSCSEVVRSQARRCRFCLADLTRRDEAAVARLSNERREPRL